MTLPTLSLLLSSQEARDVAPTVGATGKTSILENGWIYTHDETCESHHNYGLAPPPTRALGYRIIWSGDLPALLAAMVAENEGLKRQVAKPALPWADLLPSTPMGCPTGCPMQGGKPMSMTCFHPQCPRRVT